MDNSKNVVVEQQEEDKNIETVAGQQVAGNKQQDEEQEADYILEFLESRAKCYLELDATMDDIAEQKAKEKKLLKKRKLQKSAIHDDSAMREAIFKTVGIVTDAEQEQKNRSHYATKAFFDVLALADKSNGAFKSIYNSFNPIQRVCEAVFESAKFDGDHTITIDTRKFLDIVKKLRQEQDSAVKSATTRLNAEWKKQIEKNPGIQRVQKAVAEDVKKAERFKKKEK